MTHVDCFRYNGLRSKGTYAAQYKNETSYKKRRRDHQEKQFLKRMVAGIME